jgi:hypothetical protein
MSWLSKVAKKVSKNVSKAAQGVGKTAKHEVKRATKIGFLDPLGLFQGAEKRNQRFRKAGRIGAGAVGGAMTGGIPGLIAGGGLAAIQAGQKGQGNVPLTLGRGLTDFGGGALAGMASSSIASKFAAPTIAKTAGMSNTAGIGGLISKSAAPTATASPWASILKPVVGGVIKDTLTGGQQQQNTVEVPQQIAFDRVQAILDSYNKRKERYFTPATSPYSSPSYLN